MRVSFCDLREKMKISRRQRRGRIHNTSDRRAVAATQHRAKLESDVRERGLDSDGEDAPRWGRHAENRDRKAEHKDLASEPEKKMILMGHKISSFYAPSTTQVLLHHYFCDTNEFLNH